MNEPIFFYLSGTHIPQEIVINKVGKNTISGYVSIPKAKFADGRHRSKVWQLNKERSARTL